MQWIADVNAWIGLATLIMLELVLGIDNLVFIAILVDKLPALWRNKARVVGLSLALVMRLLLLASISWVVGLTAPLFSLSGRDFSGRDAILILGGAFLLAKGTMELHERLEGAEERRDASAVRAVFWQAIVQIVLLDAVFSLDSVITAVGMVNHLPVMMIAVVVAMAVMMLASKTLVIFVGRHPTVVILCLGFLLLIGFGLILDGFGLHVPKGYLYAAIAFSVLIEMANQLGRRNREKSVSATDLRERTSSAVLRLLGGGGDDAPLSETVDVIAQRTAAGAVFRPEEKEMVRGVLDLSERTVRSIMSPRTEVEWLDLNADAGTLRDAIRRLTHSRVILARGRVDDLIGLALTKDLVNLLAEAEVIDWPKVIRQPLVLPESLNVLKLMEHLRRAPVQMAVIVDEHGSFEGVVTPRDILEAITGGFPDEGETEARADQESDGAWLVDGAIDIRHLGNLLGTDLVDAEDRYTTLAGYLLVHLGRLPVAGEHLAIKGRAFEIVEMNGRTASRVRIGPVEPSSIDA